MANPNKNTQYYKLTTKTSVPAPANKTGTIETVGVAVKGTGTLFTTEMQVGSWIIDTSQDELRRVIKVESDTLAFISDTFTVNIAAATTPSVIKNEDLNVREIAIAIPLGQADGEIDGTALEAGLPVSFGKNSDTKGNFKSFIHPVIVDASGTEANITILR